MAAKGAALMLPFANTRAMHMHLDEISRNVAAKAHGVVLMDRAGWHGTDKLKVPKNLTTILLPSRSPELNPVENIWQFMRDNWLSNRVFKSYNDIVDHCCFAWNSLTGLSVDKGYKNNLFKWKVSNTSNWIDAMVFQIKRYGSDGYHRWFDSGDLPYRSAKSKVRYT